MKLFFPHTPLQPLYREQNLPRAICRSLNLMLYANMCGNMFGIVCGGGTTAMIGLANVLGAGDLAFGILNGIPQAAALLQIPFSMLVGRTHHRKKYLLTFGLISRALWILFGLIPLVMPMAPQAVQLWTLIFLLGISSCCSAAINPCWFPWFSDLAPMSIRARWLSYRDIVIAAANVIFGLFASWLLQTLPESIRYAIVFAIGGLVGMTDMLCFSGCEEKYSTPPARSHIKDVLRAALKHKPFVRLTLMWTAWCFTSNMVSAYMNRYSMNEMGLTFMQIMIFVTMAASLGTMLSGRTWGKLMGTIGGRQVMLIACIGTVLCHGFYLFSTPGNVLPPLLANLLGAIFWTGSNLAANTLQLSATPEEGKASYIAIFSCTTCLVGTALGTVCGGALLEWLGGLGQITLLGGALDRYKVLVILAMVLRMAAVLLLVPRLKENAEE